MKILRLASALLFAAFASTLLAQTSAPAKEQAKSDATEPLIVDVHPSPYRSKIYYSTNIGNQRFDMRDATVLDMITFAYDREDQAILGGPSWIDFDRFDIDAMVPGLKPLSHNTASAIGPNPYDQLRPVLKRVLVERFHLTYHSDERPLPGYVVTVGKNGAKLADAKNPSAPNGCQFVPDKSTPGQIVVTCTSTTVAQFLASFGVLPHPAIDQTGLKKSYDFSVKFNFSQLRSRDEYIHAYTDAMSSQLGLVIAAGDVPQTVIVVDKVDHSPTPNEPGIAKLIPPLPDLEFEVATIKPAAPNEPQMIRPLGSQITFSNPSLQELLVDAWQLPTGAMLGNAPPWLGQTRYTVQVKLPPDIDARAVFQDHDLIDRMLQKLLIDRFQIKYHWGEQTQDGWVLLAGDPKMKKADPSSRTYCSYGPPDGEKSMEGADSPYDNQSHCQNVTMDQFADTLQNLAKSEVKNHVKNKTGLTGSYDFTFYYSSVRKLRAENAAAVAAAKENAAASSDPVAGMGIQDAFRKELGLRLEKQPGTYPALILDHIEQTPTDN